MTAVWDPKFWSGYPATTMQAPKCWPLLQEVLQTPEIQIAPQNKHKCQFDVPWSDGNMVVWVHNHISFFNSVKTWGLTGEVFSCANLPVSFDRNLPCGALVPLLGLIPINRL